MRVLLSSSFRPGGKTLTADILFVLFVIVCGFNCHTKCVQNIKACCQHSMGGLAALEESTPEAGPPRESRSMLTLEVNS